MGRKVKWEKAGVVGVDAGLIWVGDPCYVIAKDSSHVFETYDEFIEKLDLKKFDKSKQFDYPLGQPGLGVCVESGYGDGLYDVFVERDPATGRVAQLKVTFIDNK